MLGLEATCDAVHQFEGHVVSLEQAIIRPVSERTKRGFLPEQSVGVLKLKPPTRRDDSAVEEALHWHRIKREKRLWIGGESCLTLHRERIRNAFWQDDALVVRTHGCYFRISPIRPR